MDVGLVGNFHRAIISNDLPGEAWSINVSDGAVYASLLMADGCGQYSSLIPLTTLVSSGGGLAVKIVGSADIEGVTACSEFGFVCQAFLAYRLLATQVGHIRRKKNCHWQPG